MCLRDAWPDLLLVAIDYATSSTGIHSQTFDEVIVRPPWREADFDLLERETHQELANSFLISGLDLETLWLSRHADSFGRRLLVPPWPALRLTAKPAIEGVATLGLDVPPWVSMDAGESSVHAFARQHGWRVLVKGPTYEAVRVRSWPETVAAMARIRRTWSPEGGFVQAEIEGVEESIAFAAVAGELVGAVRMEKDEVTPEGKTWAGTVSPLDADEEARLSRALADMGWSGGGEIECVRDTAGSLWAIDWNPRFPAWIHGAALVGANLPARLIAAAAGIACPVREFRPHGSFVRIVQEIAARPEYRARLKASSVGSPTAGKHPSGMPELSYRLAMSLRPMPSPVRCPIELAEWLSAACSIAGSTPERVTLEHVALERIEALQQACMLVTRQTGVPTRVAYSVKTDPDIRLLEMAAHSFDFLEVINQAEAAAAIAAGVAADRLVVNGPAKLWPTPGLATPSNVHAWHCDSIEELVRVAGARPCPDRIGLRIRPPFHPSRFGIDVSDPASYIALVDILRSTPPETRLGIHGHFASSVIGVSQWHALARSLFVWSAAISKDAKRPVVAVDLGGGWAAGNEQLLASAIVGLLSDPSLIHLPLDEIVIEPGKMVSEGAKALVVSVAEVRRHARRGAPPDLVVDASIADLPEAGLRPHPVYWLDSTSGAWYELGAGHSRVLGRICMESDILRQNIALPASVAIGDRLVITEAGAYDSSMSYRFASG